MRPQFVTDDFLHQNIGNFSSIRVIVVKYNVRIALCRLFKVIANFEFVTRTFLTTDTNLIYDCLIDGFNGWGQIVCL